MFTSVGQIVDVIPEAALVKLADPATAAQGVDEVNAFLGAQVRGRPAELVVAVTEADTPPAGDNKVRIRDERGPVRGQRGSIPVRQVWAYFPAGTAPEFSQVPLGGRVKVAGVLGRCDLKMSPEGARLNVDLKDSRLSATP